MKKKSKKSKAVMKKYTLEEARRVLVASALPTCDLKLNLKRYAEDILPKLHYGNKKKQVEAKEDFYKNINELLVSLETDTHAGLMETFDERYRGLARELSAQIIQDYKASTSLEKALAETVAGSFIRYIDCSRRLNNELGGPGTEISENRTKFQNMLSLQVDRAHRQFLSALTTLKQLKAPALNVRVNTSAAFIGENQQFNANKLNDETIEPK